MIKITLYLKNYFFFHLCFCACVRACACERARARATVSCCGKHTVSTYKCLEIMCQGKYCSIRRLKYIRSLGCSQNKKLCVLYRILMRILLENPAVFNIN